MRADYFDGLDNVKCRSGVQAIWNGIEEHKPRRRGHEFSGRHAFLLSAADASDRPVAYNGVLASVQSQHISNALNLFIAQTQHLEGGGGGEEACL